eukprot:460313-Amphidinium_carterae.1
MQVWIPIKQEHRLNQSSPQTTWKEEAWNRHKFKSAPTYLKLIRILKMGRMLRIMTAMGSGACDLDAL